MKIPTDQNTIVQNLLRALVLLFLLRTIFVFISSTEFWGLNISYYLPKESSIIFLALAAISLLIGFNLHERKLKKNKSLEIDSKKSSFDNYVLLILLVTCSVLFLTIKIAWPFLGDGSIFAGYLFKFHETGKMTIWWTEAPSMYLQYGIYYVKLLLTSKGDSFFPFTVISVISGIFFVGISYKFSKTLSSISFMQGIILSLLLGAGGTLFFFSYMETYPLQYSFVLLYTYFAYKYFMHKSDLLRCWLVLIFCIILHLQNILLVPSFLLILYWKKTEGERRYPSVYKVLLLTSPVLLAIYGASQFFLQENSV